MNETINKKSLEITKAAACTTLFYLSYNEILLTTGKQSVFMHSFIQLFLLMLYQRS